MMSAAYLVNYTSPSGCYVPKAVVTFDAIEGEDLATLAPKIKKAVLLPRGGEWKDNEIKIVSIEYIGPWFDGNI